MPALTCAVRRVGDQESRTEEYEVSFSVGGAPGRDLRVKYQAARAFEINAALDSCAGTAREAISAADPSLPQPTDEALSKFSWRTIQSAKYEGGEKRKAELQL